GSQWVYRVFKTTSGQLREERSKVIITAEKTEELPYRIVGSEGKEVIYARDGTQVWVRCTRFKISDDPAQKPQFEDIAVLKDVGPGFDGVYRVRSADKDLVPPLRFFSFDSDKKPWKALSRMDDKKFDVTFSSELATVTVPAGKFDGAYHIFAKDC